jgi:hypothetical protein
VSRSRPSTEEVTARRSRVLQLRAAGLSYQEIARQTGHKTAAAAAQDATRALRDRQAVGEPAGLFGTLELERIDSLERAMQTVLRTAAGKGDHETVLKSVDRLTRLSERRSRLLGDGGGNAGGGHSDETPGRYTASKPGPVEQRVRADIGALMTSHPMGEALTEMCHTLARNLDNGAGLATAAVNRELRANLAELSRLAVDDGDELADELSVPELPSPVRDSAES